MKTKIIDPTKLTFEMLDAFLSQPNTSAGILAAIEAAPAVDLNLAAGDFDLQQLQECADKALDAAFHDPASANWCVNWGDLSCVGAEKYIDEIGRHGYRVRIEEASCNHLSAFVAHYLSSHGFGGVEVITDW